ncbi:zinc ribbon domain-containing protein [uncultured Alistipes sp.]
MQPTICKSCGMPPSHPDDFGTHANGSRSGDYCRYCFKNGALSQE